MGARTHLCLSAACPVVAGPRAGFGRWDGPRKLIGQLTGWHAASRPGCRTGDVSSEDDVLKLHTQAKAYFGDAEPDVRTRAPWRPFWHLPGAARCRTARGRCATSPAVRLPPANAPPRSGRQSPLPAPPHGLTLPDPACFLTHAPGQVLVANAGVGRFGAIEDMTLADFDLSMKSVLRGRAVLARADRVLIVRWPRADRALLGRAVAPGVALAACGTVSTWHWLRAAVHAGRGRRWLTVTRRRSVVRSRVLGCDTAVVSRSGPWWAAQPSRGMPASACVALTLLSGLCHGRATPSPVRHPPAAQTCEVCSCGCGRASLG